MIYKNESIKVNVGVTILFSNEGMTIQLEDRDSGITFCEVEATPEETTKILGRHGMASVKDCTVYSPEKIGKVLEMDTLEFEMPEKCEYGDKVRVAKSIAKEKCPNGWIEDAYFNSQRSFFRKDGKDYARTLLRRWVEAK